SGTLTINKALATVTLTAASLNQTYDGMPKSVAVTINPANLSASLTYTQSGAPVSEPTNVGSYTVTATINDPNYEGSASGTLIISNTSANIVLSAAGLNKIYDGTPKPVTATTTPPGLNFTVAYNGFPIVPTDTGNYDV